MTLVQGVDSSESLLQRCGVIRGVEVEDIQAGALQTSKTSLQLPPNTGCWQGLLVPWICLASHNHLLLCSFPCEGEGWAQTDLARFPLLQVSSYELLWLSICIPAASEEWGDCFCLGEIIAGHGAAWGDLHQCCVNLMPTFGEKVIQKWKALQRAYCGCNSHEAALVRHFSYPAWYPQHARAVHTRTTQKPTTVL